MNFQTRPRYEARKKANQGTNFPGVGFIILLIIVFFGIFGYFSIRGVGSTIITSGTYTLEKGASLATLPTAFKIDIGNLRYKLYLRFFAPKISLQAGTYNIDEPIALDDMFETTLKKPSYTDLTITVLPGWNIYDIDLSLSQKKILETGAILIAARDHFSEFQKKYPFLEGKQNLEGFLYPDTYRILQSADAYMILDKLLSEWEKRIGESYMKIQSDSKSAIIAYNTLILASIVEREERKKSEQPIVAGILAKRVKEGIPMGADATVCYEYAKTQKQCTPTFIASVITEKTPYNTRNKQGYPPTPISSISRETWDSVVNSVPSPYYYYLHDKNGEIHYGKSLSEHNANKAKYLN